MKKSLLLFFILTALTFQLEQNEACDVYEKVFSYEGDNWDNGVCTDATLSTFINTYFFYNPPNASSVIGSWVNCFTSGMNIRVKYYVDCTTHHLVVIDWECTNDPIHYF